MPGDGKWRAPLTRRETANELATGCGYLVVVVLALPALVLGVLALFVGTNVVADWMIGAAMRAFEAPIVRVTFGVTMIVLAAWGTVRVYRRRALPEVTALAVVLWVVTDVILVSLGVIALAAAVNEETGVARF
jgi:hypothetical protein